MRGNESNHINMTSLASPRPQVGGFVEIRDTVIFDVDVEQMLDCDALISLLPEDVQRLWYMDEDEAEQWAMAQETT